MLEGGISAKPNREAAQRLSCRKQKGVDDHLPFCAADKESTGEEVIPDPDADVEENILHTLAVQRVREVVDALPEEDAALLRALYLQTPPLTLRAYREKTGIPVMTLHYRKEKLLRLLTQQI